MAASVGSPARPAQRVSGRPRCRHPIGGASRGWPRRFVV